MLCILCQQTYQGLHWCAGMSARHHGTRTPDGPTWESIRAAHERLRGQSPLMTPSDFLNPVVGGRVVVGPHTPTVSRPSSCESRESARASSSMSDRQTAMEERMESMMETVRALSRQSSRHSEILQPQSPASPPPSPEREDAYSDISEAESDNESDKQEEVMETEDEVSEYEDEEVNEAVRNSVMTVGYSEEVIEASDVNNVVVACRESANCVVEAGLEVFEKVGAAGQEHSEDMVAIGFEIVDNLVAAGLAVSNNVAAVSEDDVNNVAVAGPSTEQLEGVSAVEAREEFMEVEERTTSEPKLVNVVAKPQEAMNKARAMLNLLEPVGRGGSLPSFVGPFVRPIPLNPEPSRVIHLRSVIQRVYLPGGGVMETETVVKGPVVVDRACSP